METKRKKSVVTMRTRLEAISRIEKGEPLRKIAQEYGVGISTVSDWKKHRKDIQEFCALMLSKDCLEKRVTTKKAKDRILDDALYKWYREEVQHVKHVPGPVLQKKALCLNKELGTDPTFSASSGWLCRWKARHGISPQQRSTNRLTTSSSPSSTTTSASTTAFTTSSFTTTSLTTVTVTTTMSTMTMPTCSVTSAYQHEPSTSGILSVVIKEEYDDKLELSHMESEICEDANSQEFQFDQHEPDCTQDTDNDINENFEPDCTQDTDNDVNENFESNANEFDFADTYLQNETLDEEIAKSQYVYLQQDMCDRYRDLININPLRRAKPNVSTHTTTAPRSSSNNENIEQILRVHYLKTMIKKEKELLDVKIKIGKVQLMKEETEAENIKMAHTLRMENLYLENQLLKIRLQGR